MLLHFLVSVSLCVLTTAEKNLTAIFFQPPPDLKLNRIPDVIEGHEDLYLASEFPYRTDNGFQWVGVLSSTGATSLEGAHFDWSNVAINGRFDAYSALAYITSYKYGYIGMVEVKVTLANGEEVTLKSWLETKTGCWTNTPWYESLPGVDEFGEEWPYMLLRWYPQGAEVIYGTATDSWCQAPTIYSGSNPCDSFRGFGTEPSPSEQCGEIPSKYQAYNITIVQDGDGIIQYYTQGRSRRFTPTDMQPSRERRVFRNDLTQSQQRIGSYN
eukprot:Gregarina_sp_Pseudo_9__1943@NODE_2338_length_1034_cov_170_283417_g2153_i0_p1_GENE_NODE_2338_length_1034_cov_170_283417_g2153_i0NODE_2338_length_1034_cov_170_283417_g2153_i0_p1_ORF_typecomplete_len270_score2_80_NODE_2338_length_1034_cov_170_283417_g2153_i0122931